MRGLLLEDMEYEHRAFEPHCVDSSIGAPIPVLDDLQDASRTESPEWLGLLVLLARLSKGKSISKEVLHRDGQGSQILFPTPQPAQRFQGWRFAIVLYYTHMGITSGLAAAHLDTTAAKTLPSM